MKLNILGKMRKRIKKLDKNAPLVLSKKEFKEYVDMVAKYWLGNEVMSYGQWAEKALEKEIEVGFAGVQVTYE